MSTIRVACVVAALCGAWLTGCDDPPPPPLPEMVPIADFVLTDQDGEDFGTEQLRGKVWVADMFFTSCPEICPMLSAQMANLHQRVRSDDVRFVSISVDPEVDTPEVLTEYAARYSADTDRWTFLTGEPEDVRRVILRSFRLPAEQPYELPDGRYDILHTARFILVDQRGVMRGLYETDRAGLERIERDIERLLAESPGG